MKLTLRLRFHTRVGQSLWLSHHGPSGGAEKAVPLQYLNEEFWQTSIELPPARVNRPLSYDYILRNADGSEITDWGEDRALVPAAYHSDELLVIDSWNDAGAAGNAFYTEPFKAVLLKANQTDVPAAVPRAATHTFRVKAPLLAQGQTLCLLGEGAALANWNQANPLLLHRTAGQDYFSVQMDLHGQHFPCAYKYGVFDVEKKSFVRFEDGANRVLHDSVAPKKHTVVNDGFVVLPSDTWRGAGVSIPIFSLRSENSFGVGEFADLKPFADWGRQVGLKLIQTLPVNDTIATHTWTDSYPYAAISAFALHPQYINLAAVVSAKNKKLLAALEPERRRLNALEAVDYEAVMKAKLGFLKKIFPSEKVATFRGKEYKKFFAENEHWLVPYAAFCFLRDKFGTADFNEWPEHKSYDAKKIAALVKKNGEVAFHFFVQFHLHRQLQDATLHAHANGLVVKGDIAIGVYQHGTDVWRQPELFHTHMQAGAPPDPFAAKGQNWGFPTYSWTRMAADGFAWWKHRFAHMSNYFDAFRIDHILGFFRIWSIPEHAVEGILGYFVPAIPVDAAEFAALRIPLDRARFTKPFITDVVLREVFGDQNAIVYREFLKADPSGFHALKPRFATQKQVEKYFAARKPTPENLKLKIGLFDLISNVILFDAGDGDGKKFHFRFGMEQTISFKYLPPETQARLRGLYVDYFFRRQDDFWMREAMQKLPELKRVTNMLVCGEDLGLVPACVPVLMKGLGLLSLEIQRMPKMADRDLSRPAEAPYLSVVTPSTHDMSTIRGWWGEDRKLIQKFYNAEFGLPGEAPRECEPRIVQAVVRQHLTSPAMWSIFQLQELLGMDGHLRRADVASERINQPDNPKHYWRYRMHLTIEQLQHAESFNTALHGMVRESGRNEMSDQG